MAAGREREDLSTNGMLAMALTRCLEILGEAAAKLSPDCRLRFPSIPVSKMVAMRNRLIHAYFDLDHDVLWTTVTVDLPALLPLLDHAIVDLGGKAGPDVNYSSLSAFSTASVPI